MVTASESSTSASILSSSARQIHVTWLIKALTEFGGKHTQVDEVHFLANLLQRCLRAELGQIGTDVTMRLVSNLQQVHM